VCPQVHLLNEEERGPTLEAVVSRMKTIQGAIGAAERQSQDHSDVRLVQRKERYLLRCNTSM
jgi:hypothetical protein